MDLQKVLDLKCYGRIPFNHLCELFYETKEGEMLKIYQTRGVPSIGSWVYDAAYCLAKYIESDHFKIMLGSDVSGKSMIELGAGTGLVGLTAGCYGINVMLTELESLVPLLQLNVDSNQNLLKGKTCCMPLIWGSEEMIINVKESLENFDVQPDSTKNHKIETFTKQQNHLKTFDIIVLANCVYYESSLTSLLDTVLALTNIHKLPFESPHLSKHFNELSHEQLFKQNQSKSIIQQNGEPNDFVVVACYEERTSDIKKLINKWHFMASQYFKIEEVNVGEVMNEETKNSKYYKDFIRIVTMKIK